MLGEIDRESLNMNMGEPEDANLPEAIISAGIDR
jgi:hypothetical protein